MYPKAIRIFCFAGFLIPACYGQATSPNSVPGDQPPLPGQATSANSASSDQPPLPRFGLGVSIGLLGAGIQAGTAVQRHLNVRGGFNYFSYSLSGHTSDNIAYNGSLRLESAEALVDYVPVKWFHLSGGAALYDGFQGKGTINEPGGHSFTLNSVTYYSSPADPVTGTGKIVARTAAPEAMLGFGNLLLRGKRHFTVTSDFGVIFQGSPMTTLNLIGSTCATPTTGCAPISQQPAVQANVTAEQSKINKDLKPFNFYPILRITFGYKF